MSKLELKNIILHIPECYALIEVYLSPEQRKYAQKAKFSCKEGVSQESVKENSVSQSVSKLTSEPSESKLQKVTRPSTANSFFKKFSDSNKVNEHYTVLAGAEKKSWSSMWKLRKVNVSFSQSSEVATPQVILASSRHGSHSPKVAVLPVNNDADVAAQQQQVLSPGK